ncbi:MAG: hypothetical protein HRT37_25430, partial [Alteromonadaceae bacterium]|nr:hypothetical protein [Alteromonadaceae bacterium]
SDTSDPGEKGETVAFGNSIYKEMGLEEQVSYLAYDQTGKTHVTNFEYTQGQVIDRAFTLRSETIGTDDFDSSIGGELNDLIIGNERANTLVGGAGSDFLYGGDGNDHLVGGEGADYLNGGNDDSIDTAFYTNSNAGVTVDLSEGIGKNGDAQGDILVGIESLVGSAYDDKLVGDSSNNELAGGEGDDELNGGVGADVLDGGKGTDDIAAYTGSNSGININLFTETASGGDAEGDTLISIENIVGSAHNDNITGDDQDNKIEGMNGADTLAGGKGNDDLSGGSGNDTLLGEAGDDVLIGGSGNDSLDGGIGNDTLEGNAGNDIYLFNLGDGQDTVFDSSGIDKIVFGEGITAENCRITHDNTQSHWIVELLDDNGDLTGDKITVENAYSNTNHQIESFEFSDGTSLNLAEIQLAAQTLYTEPQPQPFYITHDNNVDDQDFYGSHLDDGYLYNLGGGNDTINELDGYGFDTIVFGADITPESIEFFHNEIDLTLIFPNQQTLTILNYYAFIYEDDYYFDEEAFDPKSESDYYIDSTWTIERFEFADGSFWGAEYSNDSSYYDNPYVGNDSSETINGSDGDDIIHGGKGDDTLNGGLGDDTYLYNLGDGNDIISDSYGSNTLSFGESITPDNITVFASGSFWSGALTVNVSNGEQIVIQGGNEENLTIQSFRFFDGTIWEATDILANMVVAGTDGDDNMNYKNLSTGATYNMGLGNDIIYGGTGDDIYLFNVGDGQDILSDSKGTDKIVFGEGLTADNLRITHDDTQSHWIVELLDDNGDLTGDKITVENAYATVSGTVSGEKGELLDSFLIESFEFSDGTSMSFEQIQAAANLDDSLAGSSESETLNDGNDNSNDFFSLETLLDGAGIIADYISMTVTDILITVSDYFTNTIANWTHSYSSPIDQFEFDDDTVGEATDIISNVSVEADITPVLNQTQSTTIEPKQSEPFSENSSIDSNLNLLIQSYSSFDDASDESGLELSKKGNSIVLPVIESAI